MNNYSDVISPRKITFSYNYQILFIRYVYLVNDMFNNIILSMQNGTDISSNQEFTLIKIVCHVPVKYAL